MTIDKFLSKIEKKESGCWEWQGFLNSNGYGMTNEKPVQLAHRMGYLLLRGEIPDNKPLDHLCRNPKCVNPEHLEPVTHRENILRGLAPAAINARKTHCINGHKFTDENTIIRYRRGYKTRDCRECGRARSLKWKKKQRGK